MQRILLSCWELYGSMQMGDMGLCLVILCNSIQRTENKLTKTIWGNKNYICNTDSESMVLIAGLWEGGPLALIPGIHMKGSRPSEMPSQPQVLGPSALGRLPFPEWPLSVWRLLHSVTLCYCHLQIYIFSSHCKSSENKVQNLATCVALHTTWSN